MVTFSLVEDGADRCLGGINHKRQLGTGTEKGQRCRLDKTGLRAFKGSQLTIPRNRLTWRLVRGCGFSVTSLNLAWGAEHLGHLPCDRGNLLLLSQSCTCPRSPSVRFRLGAGKPLPGVAGAGDFYRARVVFGGMHVRGRWLRKPLSREEMRHSHGCVAGDIGQGWCRNLEHGSHHKAASRRVLIF